MEIEIFLFLVLRKLICRISHGDLSDYTCVARNGEGRIHHTVRVVIAGQNTNSFINRFFLHLTSWYW